MQLSIAEEFPGLKVFLQTFLQENPCMVASQPGRNLLMEKVLWYIFIILQNLLHKFVEYEPNIWIPTVHKHAIFVKFQWWFLMAMNFEHNQVLRIITRLVMKGYIGTDDDIHWLSVRSVRLVNGRNDMPIPNDYTHGRCQTCIVIYFKGNNQYL